LEPQNVASRPIEEKFDGYLRPFQHFGATFKDTFLAFRA
jgi:hypothetical protein